MIKPGWQSTEFWTTLIGQLLALLAILGIIQGPDAAALHDALSKCIAAAFVLATNAWVVVRYIQSRTQLKQAAARAPNVLPVVLLAWLVLAAFGWLATPVHAEPALRPSVRVPACLIRIERPAPRDDTALLALMQQMIGLQQQSLANQHIILALLHQQRPTPVAPHAELPIAGRPRQDLPIESKPKQELPEPGRPRQELPESGKPRQDLPGAAPPKQQLPAAPLPPVVPGRALPMQRYSVLRSMTR